MKKIGVSSCFFHPDPERKVFGPKYLNYFERDMARFLSRADVMPILIPDLEKDHLEKFISQMDGFVFQGGSDMSPKSYNEPFLDEKKWPGDFARDQYELKIMKYAFEAKKPILAICRGFQVANVFFGGTLHQDISTNVQTTIEHRNAQSYDRVHHPVDVEANGLLAKLYQSKKITVNSVHHQCVKKLGDDLFIEAKAEDGIIEAFSYEKNDQFVLAVQWHPEFSHTITDKVCDPNKLYDFFLTKVRG